MTELGARELSQEEFIALWCFTNRRTLLYYYLQCFQFGSFLGEGFPALTDPSKLLELLIKT